MKQVELDFSLRLGSLEVRSCGNSLLSKKPHNRATIIKWFGGEIKACCTIAYFEAHKEGYDLRFVGERPFGKEVDRETFMELAEFGHKKLMDYFRKTEFS